MLSESAAIHSHLLEVAATLGEPLAQAIEANGALVLIASQSNSLPQQLCHTVAGQQLSTKAAQSIWNRVVASANSASLIEHFSNSDVDSLRGCGLSAAEAKAIIGIAQAAQSGQLEATELSALSTSERTARLTALWGVGQWTADMINLFYFGDADVWPDGDVTARKTLERLTSKRRKTQKTAACFSPHRSYLALHMWRYVDA